MCKLLFYFKKQDPDAVSHALQIARKAYEGKDNVSFGKVGFGQGTLLVERFAKAPTDPAPLPHATALYHFRLKKGSGDSTIANAHPYVMHDRYAFMHNGVFEALQGGQGTDSAAFMALWLGLLKGTKGATLLTSLKAALDTVCASGKRCLANLVMADVQTGEFVAYRHGASSKAFPALWYDAGRGMVSNFKVNEAVMVPKGDVLYRRSGQSRFVIMRKL